MATISIRPATLNLAAVAGFGFSLQLTLTGKTSTGGTLPVETITTPVVVVRRGTSVVTAAVPLITEETGSWIVTWTATKTSLIGKYGNLRYYLVAKVQGTAADLLAGSLAMATPTGPGTSTSNAATLTVDLGAQEVTIMVVTGARGPKGDTGATGPIGPTGPTGTPTSVMAEDGSVIVGGTDRAVTLQTGTLDVVATDRPAAAPVSFNGYRAVQLGTPTTTRDAVTKEYAFYIASQQTAVLSYGADPTGTADSSSAINAAIVAAGESALVSKVRLPRGTYLITHTLMNGNGSSSGDSTYGGVSIEGGGPPGSFMAALGEPFYVTRLIAGPSLTGPLLQVSGPLQGWALSNLYLDNTVHNVASLTGIQIVSSQYGTAENLWINGFFTGIRETAVAAIGSEVTDTIHNRWSTVSITPDLATGSTAWVMTSGASTTNTCYEDVENLAIRFNPTGTHGSFGIVLGWCDSCVFRLVHFAGRGTANSVKAVVFNYANGHNSNGPMGCTVATVDFGRTTVTNCVTNQGSAPSQQHPNLVSGISSVNGLIQFDPNLENCIWTPGNVMKYANTYPTVASPAVPASGTAARVSWSVPVNVYVTAGTTPVTIAVNAATVCVIPANGVTTVRLAPGDTITWSGTAAPTWKTRFAGAP